MPSTVKATGGRCGQIFLNKFTHLDGDQILFFGLLMVIDFVEILGVFLMMR